METKQAASILEKHRIKPSYLRLRIYCYLAGKRNHPTVDTIYRDLSPEIPTLSRTTVYNTLNLFARSGLVQTLTIEENENRYDAETALHAHFKCDGCGEITDIYMAASSLQVNLPEGFLLREKQLYTFGTCPRCLSGR
ncbi:MAG: Fur family transcriptional regulator [Spirochaetota bacterium]